MVPRSILEDVILMEGLNEKILNLIAEKTDLRFYQAGAVIFEMGAPAKEFFMLKEGKILLEIEIGKDIIISLGSIKTGYSFGWSSLVRGATYTTYAVAVEPSEVLVITGQDFLSALDQDPASGYLVMTRVFHIFRRRLERRTNQFVKVMRKHPEIQKLLEL